MKKGYQPRCQQNRYAFLVKNRRNVIDCGNDYAEFRSGFPAASWSRSIRRPFLQASYHCRNFPCAVAADSIFVGSGLWIFYLSARGAFSASTCKNLAKFTSEKKTSPSSSSILSCSPEITASFSSANSSVTLLPHLAGVVPSNQPVSIFPVNAWL